MKTKLTLLVALLIAFISHAQSIYKSSIDSGGASASAGNIQVVYTLGEVFVAEVTADNISLSEGFISAQQLAIKIDPVIFLQGPYNINSGLMNDNLRSTGNIPSTSPYIDAISCSSSVFNITGNDAIIDWVWLELRDSGDAITVVSSRSALLQSDGDVVDTDGVSPVAVNIQAGNYYIVLSHRNHLGVLTSNAINLSGGVISLDLAQNSALVTGGTNAIKDMGDGKFALFAGDFNGDGQVQNTDKNAVEPLRGISGYNNGDVDMNGEVQNTDLNSVLNPNIGKGEQYASKKLNAKRRKK